MKQYPIAVPRESYRGSNPKRLAKQREFNRIAAKVEKHINDALSSEPDDTIHQFLSGFVAIDLREDTEAVRRAISRIDAGSNGVTIFKGDYSRAMARLTAPSHS